ncbi:DUF1983 domain-containing protein [Paenalcaligenes sp. Me131]|uniref:phage tail tip fiber protein n=1 Tax=Paenalcaligenes sp. Me131 TaxID=3392636 RepID=UPI003D27515D
MPAVVPVIAAALSTAVGKFVATMALSLALGSYQQSRARKKAREAERAQRDAYNRSLKDRHVTVRSGVSTRKYVLGRVRVGGTLMHIESNGKHNTALDSILAMACNQCALDGYYLGDEFVAVSAFPGDKYGNQKQIDFRQSVEVVPGTNKITLTHMPVNAASVRVSQLFGVPYPTGDVSVNGDTVTINHKGTSKTIVIITYKYFGPHKIRMIFKDGDPNQLTDGWADVETPLWTSEHRLRGVAYLRMLNLWDEDIYHSGAPQIGAVLKGGWVDGHPYFDPRTGSNPQYTTNPAILAAWYMTLPRSKGGMGIPDEWVDWPYVSAAANICDELITVKKLDGSGHESIKRYECNTLIDTGSPPVDNLNIILSSMAGDYVFTAGRYRIFAGAFRPAMVVITDDDIVGDKDISLDKSGQDDAPANVVTSTFVNESRNWLESSPRPVRNEAYVLADGAESPLDLSLPATTDERQAAYLMGVALESARPSMAGEIPVLGVGEDLAVMDTVQLDLSNRPEYAGKTFQIVNRVDNWDGTFSLTIQEIRANVWSLDPDTFLPTDPAPVPDTSYLWNVAPITNFIVGAQQPQSLADGTAVIRIDLTWDLHSQPYVREGGRIEVRYRIPSGDWISVPPALGSETGTSFTAALENGLEYQFQARAVNGVGAASNWTDNWIDYDGVRPPPPAITSLTAKGILYGIDLAWSFPGTKNALRHTEIRHGITNKFADSVPLGDFAYPTNMHTRAFLPPGRVEFFWARLVDANGTDGPWFPDVSAPGIRGMVSADAEGYNELITQQILESALGDQIWNGIQSLPDIQQKLDELSKADQHDPALAYLSGSVVVDNGKMYRAKKDVPKGIPITNEAYWQHIGDYESINAAIAALALQTRENTQQIEEIEGVVTATATSTSTLMAAYRDNDDGEGLLSDVLNEWDSRAWISDLRRTRVTAEQAEAIVQQQVGAQLAGVVATVEEISQSVLDIEGKFNATQSVRLAVNDNGIIYTAGYGIGMSNESGVTQSQFVVLADNFAVMHAPNGTPQAVFTIQNGVVSMNTALIGRGTISFLQIGDDVQSVDYIPGQRGWRLGKGGDIEFNGSVPGQGRLTMNNQLIQFFDELNRLRMRFGFW